MDHNGPPDRGAASPTRSDHDGAGTHVTTVDGLVSSRGGIDAFLRRANPLEAIAVWLGVDDLSHSGYDLEGLLRRLSHDVSMIDALLSEQVSAILHHTEFQKLEAVWRGLSYLTEEADQAEGVKIKVLSASWTEVSRDMNRAMEFDQSQLFRKVYTEEFGMPGGEPIGLLIGDYEVQHQSSPDHRSDDIPVLQGLAEVAAAAFSPFIAGVSPGLLGIESFDELELPINLQAVFSSPEYTRWRSFRENEDSRFLALTLPRIMLRRPHGDNDGRADGFRFQEVVADDQGSGYLWGNAAFAFAAVVIRSFGASGWLSDIRGVEVDRLAGGLVLGLPGDSYETDREGLVPKPATDVQISDGLDKDLAEFGLLSLSACKDTELAAFYSSPSLQKPKVYDKAVATTNARISATLQHVLCTSRFAHYLKVMARDKVGSFLTATEVERFLNTWLLNYCTQADDASADIKARYPLREGNVQVKERPGRPGDYLCTIYLKPHYQFDQVVSSVELVTQLSGTRAS